MKLTRIVGRACALAAAATLIGGAGQALAASNVNLSTGVEESTLLIGGEADDDKIAVSVAGGTVTITDGGTGGITTAAPQCTSVNPTTVTCPLDPPDPAPPASPVAAVGAVTVSLLAGDDTLSTNTLRASASGQEGNDTLVGGDKANFLSGGGGNDTVTGGPANDQLSGDEFIETATGGADTVAGSGGDDFIITSGGNDSADGGGGQDQIQGGFGDDTVLGGDGDDTLGDGGSGTETGGNDDVNGQGGEDIAAYQRQADVNISLDGQANDGIAGEADNVQTENVFAGSGNDTLTGDETENFFSGGPGNDQLHGFGGADGLLGGSGDDLHDGGAGRDAAQCGSGHDTVLLQLEDSLLVQCERTGAEVAADTATVSKEKTVKVRVRCPAEEGAACAGELDLSVDGKSIGSEAFTAEAGTADVPVVELNKRGKKLLEKNGGSLLATAQATTTEPGGTAAHEGEVLVKRKPKR